MKKTTTALILTFAFQGMMAQENNEHPHLPPRAATEVDTYTRFIAETDKPETPIWSEDFANGLPAAWSTSGSSDSALWEYRGPATTPNNTVGSRGAFSGNSGLIQSPTVSNGFMIFDSDYLDNDGIMSNLGMGKAPSPHKGYLISGPIDLTGHPNVELKFNSYAYNYSSKRTVHFSIDGGITWTDSMEVHPTLLLNASTPVNEVVSLNVGPIIGNQANVRLRFTYEGNCNGPSICGYYFWMLDDIQINEAPRNSLIFEKVNGRNDVDILFAPNLGSSSKSGHVALGNNGAYDWDQTRGMAFFAKATNNGWDTQTNVRLRVKILDSNNVQIDLRTSQTPTMLLPGQSITLNTAHDLYIPPGVNQYKAAFFILSDSTGSQDTVPFFVTEDYMSNDFGMFHNSIGTEETGDDGSAIATRIDIVEPMQFTHVWVGLSPDAQSGGEVEIAVYDTGTFSFITGFPQSTYMGGTTHKYTITPADIAQGFMEVPISGPQNPLALNLVPQDSTGGGYYFVLKMYSDGGSKPIAIKNDQRLVNTFMTTLFYSSVNMRWFFSFAGTSSLNHPWIRPKVNKGISVDEVELQANLRIGPNPTSGLLHVMFDRLPGQYNLTLTDLSGREVLKESLNISGPARHTLDLGSLPKGMYVLSVENGKASVRYKVVVE